MFKRLILNNLFRLRGFMQEELQAQLRGMQDDINHLHRSNQALSRDHERLRAALNQLELFDQSVKTIESGLLTMAVQQTREPVFERKTLKTGTR
jgi:regulator of replication initiation timing